MTAKQAALKAKHGTPAQFARAVYRTIGEVSADEAKAAIAKYNQEWRAASDPPQVAPAREVWVKITVHLALIIKNYQKFVPSLVARFETAFRVKHLYYARYTTLKSSTIEISALTSANWRSIEVWFLAVRGIYHVNIVDRTTGSLAHAYMYQAIKRLPAFDKDLPEDDALLDVLHWGMNQRGMDYIREARAYTLASLRILHKMALESASNLEAMRQFNREASKHSIAQSLVERLNLLGRKAGRGRKTAKAAANGPAPTPPKSAPAGAGIACGSKRSRSAGSGRR